MSTQDSKKNEYSKFLSQFTDKLDLKNPNKNMALANLSIYYTWKTLNLNKIITHLKFLPQIGMMNLICLMDHILFLILQDYFENIIEKHETIVDNSPVQIYVNKIKSKIVFKMKTGYKLELLSEETIKLLGRPKKRF